MASMRHLRIAGAEDAIGRHLDVELLFHRRLDVDLGQDAESLVGQCRASARVDGVKFSVRYQAVDRVVHCRPFRFMTVIPAATSTFHPASASF